MERPSPPAQAPASKDRDGFRALRHPGYRIYLAGLIGRGSTVWIMIVSIPWYALELGAGPAELGIISGLLFLPTLFISPFGGVLADRVDRGRVLLATQTASLVLALVLAGLAWAESGTVLATALLALGLGIVTAVELPVRQAYLTELIPPEDVSSAVALHASVWNTTRFIGPAIAGLLIGFVGVAASYLAASIATLLVTLSIVVLERYRFYRVDRGRPPGSVWHQLREGAAFAWSDASIRWALVFVTAGSILGIQCFQTLSPLYVSETLGLSGGGYGLFMAVWGGGAVVAAYVITAIARGDRRPWLAGGATGLAVLLAALALIDLVPLAFVVVAVLGFAQIALVQNALVSVQHAAPDAMRGRIMGLYTTVFQGTSPFGAVFAGVMAAAFGVTAAMLLGAALLGAVVVLALVVWRRTARRQGSGVVAAADGT